MTIPDIGHCAGSGAAPVEGTVQAEGGEAKTGVCPACSGSFELHPSGVVTTHDAAEIEVRETWPTNPK
jgi:hypothetical protein